MRERECPASAREAGLYYGSDRGPGILRKRKGRRTYYVNAAGREIKNRPTLARIRALAIPPAWTEVWIAPRAQQHLQATGRDSRGRMQYKYHANWREHRDRTKFANLISFARGLPKIRRRVAHDLKGPGLGREKVLALIVHLLETLLIRVGNEEYARNNHSFGLTTMLDRHATVDRARVRFHFRGKSGITHELDLRSQSLARIVKRCQDLPGQQLFQYRDAQGKVHDIGSADVNQYLRAASGLDISAKDFRTWAGTWLAAQALKEFEAFDSDAAAKRNVTRAIERVAARLGNTPTVCRKCYIHPEIIAAYLDRTLLRTLQRQVETDLKSSLNSLPPAEAVVLALWQERMKRQLNRRSCRAA